VSIAPEASSSRGSRCFRVFACTQKCLVLTAVGNALRIRFLSSAEVRAAEGIYDSVSTNGDDDVQAWLNTGELS
jgi:hypothetical protein